MNSFAVRIILSGGLLIMTVVSGIVLSNGGRPLQSGFFTVHKLIAVGAIILLAVSARSLAKGADMDGLSVAALAVSGALFLVLIVTGALLSFDKLVTPLILRIHQLAPAGALLASAVSAYLLSVGKALPAR